MSSSSKIEWSHATWNPVTGCTKTSAACTHCYAERFALRLQAMGMKKYKNGFSLTLHEDVMDQPLHWNKPRIIFTASMGDMFHEKIPDAFIMKIFEVMNKANQHIYQILTKRSKRLLEMNPKIPWGPHIWMGVTVESADYTWRIEHLRKTGAQTKFLCMEPLLGLIPNLNLQGIDWVIVGGESGPGARPMKKEWAIQIRDQCIQAKVPFFFKQWGGVNKHKTGRLLEGKLWEQIPKFKQSKTQLSLF
jgi:protein gp37